MAPRPIWKGAISFGMVVIPVRLYRATHTKDIAFVTLHRACHKRIRQRRYCPYDEVTVEPEDTVRGYEYTNDQFVMMEDNDFENLPVPSTHTVEIQQFVDISTIDPMYFDQGYLLEPDDVAAKPYFLLKRALESTGRVGIAKVSLRQKEHLCCLRPYSRGIAMTTMHYPDELDSDAELNVSEGDTSVRDEEIKMATLLIDQMTRPFEPGHFQDEYRLALERVIESKLGSGELETVTSAPPKATVGNLMAALKASLEMVQTQRPK